MVARVSAIVLAAGRSRRMGRPKQLLPLDGIPLIEHSLRTLAVASVDEIILVAGSLFEALTPVSRRYRARIVRNPDASSDMAASVRVGLAAARIDATGILIYPADYPQVMTSTVETLIAEHARTPENILVPVFGQRRGHPTLFPRYLLKGFGSRTTLRDIMRMHHEQVRSIPVEDRGILADIDTPEDYEALKKWRRRWDSNPR